MAIDLATEENLRKVLLERGTALRIPFVLCAHLLLIWPAPAERAHEYLDRLWDTLEEGGPRP